MTIDTARLEALKSAYMTVRQQTPTSSKVYIYDGDTMILVGKLTGGLRGAQWTAHDLVKQADGTHITTIKVKVESRKEGISRIKGWAVMTLINTPQQGDSK